MLDQARAGAKYPEYSGSLHHQPPPLRRTPPQLLHIQRASCLKAATLYIPFAATKMFLARISLIKYSVALSLDLQQLILIVQAQKPRTEFRPRRKALRGKKSSFKMPLLIIAGSDPLLLIRRTLSCLSRCLFLYLPAQIHYYSLGGHYLVPERNQVVPCTKSKEGVLQLKVRCTCTLTLTFFGNFSGGILFLRTMKSEI